MSRIKSVAYLLLTLFMLGGLAACEYEGPAEETGEEIGRGVDEAGEQTERAFEPEPEPEPQQQ